MLNVDESGCSQMSMKGNVFESACLPKIKVGLSCKQKPSAGPWKVRRFQKWEKIVLVSSYNC